MKKSDKQPKILFFDIETSHSLMAAFGIFDQNIPYGNILVEWSVISIAWKWNYDKKVHTLNSKFKKGSQTIAEIDDKKLLEDFIKVLNEADIVVGHNIDNFDLKKLRSRLIYHGMQPFKKLYTVDTYKVAKSQFAFTSNKLDYLAQYFKIPGKMSTPSGLWLDVLRGCEKAVKIMVKYNIQDVVVLEKVYYKLLPFITNHPNMNMFTGDICSCPNCGSSELRKSGTRQTKTAVYQRYYCVDCGTLSRGKDKLKKQNVQIVSE
jgi:DNA polymerase elongation subunit (family B)